MVWIYGRQSKNWKPLNDDAVEVLDRQRGKHDVFVFTYERWDGKRNAVRNCSSHAWYKAVERAKLTGLRWHDLRHTWATWHVMNGTPLPALQALGAGRAIRWFCATRTSPKASPRSTREAAYVTNP